MPWGAVVGGVLSAGAGLYGASQQAGAATTAAGEQEQAALAQEGLSSNIFNATAGMQLPSRELGGYAQSQLAYLMGLTPNLDISPDFSTPNIQFNGTNGQSSLSWNGPASGYNWNNTGPGNPTSPSLSPNIQPVYGRTTGGSQSPGTLTQPGSLGGSNLGGTTYNPSVAPTSTAGGPTTAGGLGYGGLENPYNPSTFFLSPDYNFINTQTQLAAARAGAASGQTGSGAQLTAAMQYASGLASTDFNQAYENSQQTQSTLFNELNALGTGGQVATNSTQSGLNTLGSSGASALGGYGNAAAAGTIGAANAYGSAINGIGNNAGTLGSLYAMYNNPNSPYNTANPATITPYGGGPSNQATMYATPDGNGGFTYSAPPTG